jgi:SAM-dependent methyltransferase
METDSMADFSFSKSDGNKIEFSPGFFDFHERSGIYKPKNAEIYAASTNSASEDSKDYKNLEQRLAAQSRLGTFRSSLKLSGYVSKIVPTYQMVELFRDANAQIPSRNMLDIGCGMGFHLRLMRAFGLTNDAVGVDIYDRSSEFDETSMPGLHRKFRLLRHVERFQDRISRRPEGEWSPFERAIMQRVPTVKWFSQYYGSRPSASIYDLKFKAKPKVDRVITGNVYDIDGQYDLITSFASLDFFNRDEILKKVSALLPDGAYFYLWVTNWWHAINTNSIYGQFPFASQRLTREEFLSYAQAHHPDRSDNLMKAYDYSDPSHPTLSDYVDSGLRHGLVPVSWKENIVTSATRGKAGMTSSGVAKLAPDEFDEALSDINRHRPDVRASDLFPGTLSVLFQKRPSAAKRLNEETFAKIDSVPEFNYRPSGLMGKMARALAMRFLSNR